jgi:hypothetical protein
LYFDRSGRIFVVRGKVAHDKLAATLDRVDRVPAADQTPTPEELGAACSGELTADLLLSIRYALGQWEKSLDAEARRRPARRRTTARLNEERRELARLAKRWNEVWRRQAMRVAGDGPTGASLFLDEAAEAELEALLEAVRQERDLDPLIAWQARVVAWLAGEFATRRFLQAASALARSYPRFSCYSYFQELEHVAQTWLRRAAHEPQQGLRLEIAEHLRQFSGELIRRGRIPTRLYRRSVVQVATRIVNACPRMLELRDGFCRRLPAALAALAATDRGTAAIIPRTLESTSVDEDFSRLAGLIAGLARQIGLPSYDALLTMLDGKNWNLHPSNFERLRKLLAKRNSPDDVTWIYEHDLHHALELSALKAADVRRIGDSFARCGTPIADSLLDTIVRAVRKPADLKFVHLWTAWLGSVSAGAVSPRLRRMLGAAFVRTYWPGIGRPGRLEAMGRCLVPAARGQSRDEIGPLVGAIESLQVLARAAAPLPKSLRRFVEHDDRSRGELAYLRGLAATGRLTERARFRLGYLENRLGTIGIGTAGPGAGGRSAAQRRRRAAERAFLRRSLDALRNVARELAEARCREPFGELTARLPSSRLDQFADWAEKMSSAERGRLAAVIAARRRYGPCYKRYLHENAAWVSAAAARGVDLEAWFGPEAATVSIGGRMMEIAAARDLPEVFLMGTYFETCLSIGDINEMSVLTNASDANKQVVFMFARGDHRRRSAVARQIIAVTDDFGLVGYQTYVNLPREGNSLRDDVCRAMACYAARLAARCGLELFDQGGPTAIGEHFWHDDGEHAWPAAAREAWSAPRHESELLAIC